MRSLYKNRVYNKCKVIMLKIPSCSGLLLGYLISLFSIWAWVERGVDESIGCSNWGDFGSVIVHPVFFTRCWFSWLVFYLLSARKTNFFSTFFFCVLLEDSKNRLRRILLNQSDMKFPPLHVIFLEPVTNYLENIFYKHYTIYYIFQCIIN